MINYERLSRKPKHFHRLTGLTLEEFDQVYDKYVSGWREAEYERKPMWKRKRKPGAGRKSHIKTLKDKLVFILVYVRIYPLLFIQGMLFGMAESKACEWVHRLLPILDKALGYTHKRPVRGRGKSLDEVLEEFPELRELGMLTDGVERPSQRPKDTDKQKANYSGKKKRHTRKNIVISHPRTNAVVYLGKTQDGSKNDKKCLDEEELHCRDPVDMGADLGFKGYQVKNINLRIPYKKPKGGELTESQKAQNQAFSKIRIKVEHAICGAKRNRSVADIYRNIKKDTDDLFISIACSLHNLRTAHRFT